MNEMFRENTAKIKFPTAAVLFLILAIIGIIEGLFTMSRIPLDSAAGQAWLFNAVPRSIVGWALLIFLTVCLFMKKRGGLLLGALSAGWGWNIATGLPFFSSDSKLMVISAVFFLISIAASIAAVIFSARMLLHENEPASDAYRNLWFLPAILLMSADFYNLVRGVVLGYPFFMLIKELFNVALYGTACFLLFRWMAYPYVRTFYSYDRSSYAAASYESSGDEVQGRKATGQTPQQKAAFCPFCGTKLPEDAAFCPNCGRQAVPSGASFQQNDIPPVPDGPSSGSQSNADPSDAPSGGYTALGFFIPVVGLILYLVWRDQFPMRAKSAGKGALAGVITWTALVVLIYVIYFLWVQSLFAQYY